ncbi:hypothetical protein PtA15_1A261 [Puccinia triticina]|uniref:Uncharacterized protein n=1 Tax=Puccinia triticina TaxID=208348 RepID=A0ABY7C979_9BASI|nr:uncharacterized protein PtA15_1A261 [Puccinia triticina]WAQ80923.1 hypothetical protein PtA15_1A261 [Puccinia triticina]
MNCHKQTPQSSYASRQPQPSSFPHRPPRRPPAKHPVPKTPPPPSTANVADYHRNVAAVRKGEARQLTTALDKTDSIRELCLQCIAKSTQFKSSTTTLREAPANRPIYGPNYFASRRIQKDRPSPTGARR